MTTLVLIQPPLSKRERYGVLQAGGSSLPPLGLAWLAAVARGDGHSVAIIDAEAEALSLSETAERAVGLEPRIIGITATTISVTRAARLAGALRDSGFRGTVVLGGPHVTAQPERTLNRYHEFDLAVIGEGENTLRQLLPILLSNEMDELGRVPGLCLRDDRGRAVLTRARAFMSRDELSALPLPAWDLLPSLTTVYQPSALRMHRLPSSSLVTTRGCGGGCTFCDNTVFGRRVRSFSAGYVASMIGHLVENYGVRDITIYDDNFIVNRKRLAEICKIIGERGWDLSWSCNARVDVINRELAQMARRAGCWQMSLGIESGVQEILDTECKSISLDQVRRAVGILSSQGIRTKGFFMIGHPGETVDTIEATIDFALDLPLDDFQMSFLTPFPGTAIYAEVDKWGSLDEKWDRMNMWTPVFVPRGLSADELVRRQKRAMRRFYFRPRILWRYFRDCFSSFTRARAIIRGGLALFSGLFSARDD